MYGIYYEQCTKKSLQFIHHIYTEQAKLNKKLLIFRKHIVSSSINIPIYVVHTLYKSIYPFGCGIVKRVHTRTLFIVYSVVLIRENTEFKMSIWLRDGFCLPLLNTRVLWLNALNKPPSILKCLYVCTSHQKRRAQVIRIYKTCDTICFSQHLLVIYVWKYLTNWDQIDTRKLHSCV